MPGRPRGDHRQGPREGGAPLDAHARRRQADGAAGRRGHVPGPGGRGRHRARRATRRPTPSPPCTWTTSRCRWSWTRSRPSSRTPRSSGRTAARTSRPTTSGTGSPGTGRPPTRRWPPRTGSSRSTSTSRASTWRRSRPAAASRTGTRSAATSTSTSRARRRTSTGPSSASSRGSPSRRSGSRRTTSAAGSAARCRSTRATCARSSPRSRSAGRSSGSRTARENLQADSFARDYHVHAELGINNDGTMTGLRVKTLADHGYSDAAADPSKYPAGLFNVITGSYDMPQAFVEVDAAYTNKPPGGVAYRCSFRVTEAVHTIERLVDEAARDDRHGPGRVPDEELHPEGPVPVPHPDRVGLRLGRLPHGAAEGARHDRLRRPAPGAGREARPRRADGHRHQLVHRDRGRRAVPRLRHHRHQDVRLGRDPGPSRRASAIIRLGVQTQGQGHETTFAQIVAEELGHPGGERQGRGGRHGHGALRPRHVRVALHADRRRRGRDRGPQDPREGAPDRRPPARVLARRPRVDERQVERHGLARPLQDDRRDRVRRLHQPPGRGWRPASRRRTTTTRPT